MAKLAGYRRVSSVGTRAERLRSPQEQQDEIDEWAPRFNHTVDHLEPELDGKGTNPNRPILREAVEGVKAGRWEGVVVAYLSRSGRELRLMLDLWDEIEAVGGLVFFARENIDSSTNAGKMQRNILASVAQYELEEKRDGFERSTKGAVAAGIWKQRQTPRGYDKDPVTRKLVINDVGAAEVQGGAVDFLGGSKITELAVRLGMTPGGIRAMLRNRVYLGELKVGKHVNKHAHPPILEIPVFEAVVEKLDHGRRPPRSPGDPALLAGLVRCAACGHVMTRYSGKGGQMAYCCPKYHSEEICSAPAAIGCVRLDRFAEAVALRELQLLSGRASSIDGVADAERELGAAEAELSAYLQAVDAAGIGSGDAAAGMRVRRERVDVARERLSKELARVPRLPSRVEGADIWDRLNVSERTDLLRSLFATVAVRAVGKGRTVPVTDRVRIFKFGADVVLPKRTRGTAAGIVPIPWPDLDDPRLVSVAGVEDSL